MPPPDTTTMHQQAAGPRADAQEQLSAEAASHQVVIGDIPAAPPAFQPRDGLLATLGQASERVSVIYSSAGRRGAGATQLAAAYARAQLTAGWRVVAWVNCADTGSLLAGLAAVADATGLTEDDSWQSTTDAAAAVRHWLEADGDGCLLVFDDVSDPELMQAFVPAGGLAQVLITAAMQPPGTLGSAFPVDAFTPSEASAFLTRSTGLDDDGAAAEVAAVLGHLPLTLALAAPMIAGQRAGYAWYLDQLQATSADVSWTGDDDQPYPASFARTAQLSLQAVRAADRTGMCTRLMEIIAVLSAAGVSRELLYAAGQAGVLTSGRQRVAAGQVDRALDWLSDRSLLTFSLDGQNVVLHRLVAQVIRSELGRRQTAVCEAAAFVLDVYSRRLVGSPDRRAVRGIPQQVTALLDSLAELPQVDEELAWLLLRLRFVAFYHLLELGDSTPQAIAVGEPLAEDLQRLLGADHPDTLNSRNSLAAAYLAAGRIAEAIPLFEQTLAVRQRTLGSDDPETLTSQNNLASAYQDAGRGAEAIRLYELNLEARDRLLGSDHPSTLNSRGNLAAAYRGAGQGAEAIPLLEQTLAGRERVLGPGHPDTQISRKNLATAYQDAGREAEAIPLLEQAPAGRERVPRADRPDRRTSPKNFSDARSAAGPGTDSIPPVGQDQGAQRNRSRHSAARQLPAAAFRRPPADPPKRMLPAGLRRPPADPARRPPPDSIARPPATLTGRPARQTHETSQDVQHDREIVTAIAAEDPAGIATAYDRYAADLYGYCHWMLHDSAAAAGALTDAFVVATATLSTLSEPAKLRPWLFAMARIECRRRIRPTSAALDEETDTVSDPADALPGPSDATVRLPPIRDPAEVVRGPSDATVRLPALRDPVVEVRGPSDVTVRLPPIRDPAEVVRGPSDATVQFAALRDPVVEVRGPSDATVQFAALRDRADVEREVSDAMPLHLIGLPVDATMPFHVISQPAPSAAHLGGGERAELRSLIQSILAGLKPREREVIELSFRYDLYDNDLAIALGVSLSRAQAMAARARSQLEQALSVMHIALTRRTACPVLGELLADWDGQLTEETRELVGWHIKECQTCAQHEWGALRPAAFTRLLTPAPLPPDLREQVLSRCTSAAQDAVAYRRRVIRRAQSIWPARFSRAIRQLSWSSIRAHPGVAVAAVAVALWVAAAVSVLLLTLADSPAAFAQTTGSHAPADRTGAATSSSIYVAGPPTAALPAAPAAAPSPAVSHPSAAASYPVQSPPSPEVSEAPPASSSAKPSKSPSAEPSKSASASASSSPSPTA